MHQLFLPEPHELLAGSGNVTPPTRTPHAPEPLDAPLKLLIARMANGISPASLGQAYADWLIHLLVSPARQAQLATSALRKAGDWWAYVATAAQGGPCRECVLARPQDKRFSKHEWHTLPFSALAQSFLLQEQWWDEATHGVRGVSRHHEELTSFVARQWLDMLAPSNFVATNPQVLRETLATGGLNLAGGFANWWRDAVAVASGGRPRGVEAFVPGEAVAVTPGEVVYRNHLVELIQYAPATAKVLREPVFIVPSWIMKYYILDLTPQDSMVRFLVEQGHTVFIVSWRNPGGEDAGLGMDDYLEQGVLQPLQALRTLRPGVKVHAMGYCLGGTLLAIAAAALAASGDTTIATLSLLAAQVDFQEPGELGLFIDESQLAFLEDLMAEHGYLDGRQMAGAFQLINSKDLVWSKLVHEYLMGAHTPVTPLRAWNADATRMPARMHSEYLRRLYLNNELALGKYPVRGQPVSLGTINVPTFVVATERDHVAPWHSVYKLHRLLDAPVAMVLTSGGHNVGIVNPPDGPAASAGASYRFAQHDAGKAPLHARGWQATAPSTPGSWWPRLSAWLRAHSSRTLVRATPIGHRLLQGERVPAPGTYVFQQ